MPTVRAMRMLASIENGTTNAAALEALLADGSRVGEFSALLNMRGQAKRAMAGANARAAIFGSNRAMTAMFDQDNCINALVANSTALAELATSTTYVAAIIASTAMRAKYLNRIELLTPAISSIPLMNIIAASSACRTDIGVGGVTETVAYTVMKNSHMCVTKMMAGHAGLTVASFDTSRSLWNSTGSFASLSTSDNASKFAMNSGIVCMLKGDINSIPSALTVAADAPVVPAANDSSVYFLMVGWGGENTSSATLSGTSASDVSNMATAQSDNTMTTPALATFDKVKVVANANTTNMRVGRVQGIVSGSTGTATVYAYGFIGIPTTT